MRSGTQGDDAGSCTNFAAAPHNEFGRPFTIAARAPVIARQLLAIHLVHDQRVGAAAERLVNVDRHLVAASARRCADGGNNRNAKIGIETNI